MIFISLTIFYDIYFAYVGNISYPITKIDLFDFNLNKIRNGKSKYFPPFFSIRKRIKVTGFVRIAWLSFRKLIILTFYFKLRLLN